MAYFDCDVLIILSKPIFNLLNEKKYILDIDGPVLTFLNAKKKVQESFGWILQSVHPQHI